MRGYDGESEITHNATGDKGGSKYQLKGVGQREFDVDVPRRRLELDDLSSRFI